MDFLLRVGHGIDDFEQHPRGELAVARVDVDLQFLAGVHSLEGRGLQRRHDRLDHVGTRNPLFLLHVLEDGK